MARGADDDVDNRNQRRDEVERSVRRAVVEAPHTAFPVEEIASFNENVADLLAKLTDGREADLR
ncbi:hypothetical protein Q4F19_13320 [Sphingomonas sp. BIUV-7]|uniref:Uncharacterized protein n=1 Tax=Sphingomonas natans TaxID=3063330 RepID=A0ABT8YAK0_9SPHN|nr:hypothetical protein [Sphingomonas sp. BIUV-7]MDO6415367.1 hypothetical protein [Sphingomonas sp. BIUV-7]